MTLDTRIYERWSDLSVTVGIEDECRSSSEMHVSQRKIYLDKTQIKINSLYFISDQYHDYK